MIAAQPKFLRDALTRPDATVSPWLRLWRWAEGVPEWIMVEKKKEGRVVSKRSEIPKDHASTTLAKLSRALNDALASNSSKKALEAAHLQVDALVAAWKERGDCVVLDETFELAGALITGGGNAHPINAAIAMDPTIGVPIVPGSGLRGVLRRAVAVLDGDDESQRQLQHRLFGGIDPDGDAVSDAEPAPDPGTVICLDVLPRTSPVTLVDVVNPHFGNYYQGKSAPTDDQLPVPSFFLAVGTSKADKPKKTSSKMEEGRKGWRFVIRVSYAAGDDRAMMQSDRSTLQAALNLLVQDLGLGAKTAAGYGFFNQK